MPKYNIHSAKLPGFAPACVIITTAFFNAGGYPRAESFLLMQDGKATIYAKSLRFAVVGFVSGRTCARD